MASIWFFAPIIVPHHFLFTEHISESIICNRETQLIVSYNPTDAITLVYFTFTVIAISIPFGEPSVEPLWVFPIVFPIILTSVFLLRLCFLFGFRIGNGGCVSR